MSNSLLRLFPLTIAAVLLAACGAREATDDGAAPAAEQGEENEERSTHGDGEELPGLASGHGTDGLGQRRG